jgi:hypothetical protein
VIPPLEQLQAHAAEIQDAALKTGFAVNARRRGHPSEQAVEVAQTFDILGREGDLPQLGDPWTQSLIAHGASRRLVVRPNSAMEPN